MSQWKVTSGSYDSAGRGVFTVTKGSKRLDHREQDELEALLIGWISVDDEMPPPLKDVQVVQLFEGAGKRAQMVGRYIPRFTEESSDESDGWEEYNEEDDTYYTPAGWYEVQNNWGEFAYIHCSEGPVTHWRHLSELPTN